MIDPDPPPCVGSSGPEYSNHTPGRRWPGFFVRMATSAPPTSSRCSSTGGRVRKNNPHHCPSEPKPPLSGREETLQKVQYQGKKRGSGPIPLGQPPESHLSSGNSRKVLDRRDAVVNWSRQAAWGHLRSWTYGRC